MHPTVEALKGCSGWEEPKGHSRATAKVFSREPGPAQQSPPSTHQVLPEATAGPVRKCGTADFLYHCPPSPPSFGDPQTCLLPPLRAWQGGAPFLLSPGPTHPGRRGRTPGEKRVALGAGRGVGSEGCRRAGCPGVLLRRSTPREGRQGHTHRAEREEAGHGGCRWPRYLALSSTLPSPSVLPSSSVFRSSVLSFCSFFLLTHLTTINTKMTTARKPPTEAPTMTATVESRSGGSGEAKKADSLSRGSKKGPLHNPCSPIERECRRETLAKA